MTGSEVMKMPSAATVGSLGGTSLPAVGSSGRLGIILAAMGLLFDTVFDAATKAGTFSERGTRCAWFRPTTVDLSSAVVLITLAEHFLPPIRSVVGRGLAAEGTATALVEWIAVEREIPSPAVRI